MGLAFQIPPALSGLGLLALGLWSLWFALFASIQPP